MTTNNYDFIIFGATIPGITLAIKKSLDGHSVLLTNIFGFPGGSITEQLNCLQEVKKGPLEGTAKKIYQSISDDNFEQSIVNPESMKFKLQQAIESTNVKLYFHAVPKTITVTDHGLLEVAFLAKEGVTMVKGKRIIDASEDFYGAILLEKKRIVQERRINIFITSPANQNFLSHDTIRTAVKLTDGRYWLSLAIEANDELFIEHETHTLLETFRKTLEDSNCRIQVLPLGVQTLYRMESETRHNDSFITINDMLGSDFSPSEQFLKASAIETVHTQFQ